MSGRGALGAARRPVGAGPAVPRRGRPRAAVACLGAFLAAALGVAATARPAAAGPVHEEVILVRDGPAGRALDIRFQPGLGAGLGAGFGFALVHLSTDADRPVAVALRFDGVGNDAGSVVRRVTVEKGTPTRVWMPRPPGIAARLEVRAAGEVAGLGGWSGGSRAAPVLGVADGEFAGWSTALGSARPKPSSAFGGALVELTWCTAADLPPTWAWLSAASLVLLDGGASGLDDPARQAVLRGYVRAGGRMVVLRAGSLPRGPLQEDVAEVLAGGTPARGAGVLRATRDEQLGLGLAASVLDATLGPVGAPAPADTARLLPSAWARGERVPGLGRVPVRLFFLLLVGFAVLVGPVAWIWARRRRRQAALVAIVPALGLLFAGVILGVGLVSEGFDVRGTVRSVTWLDQREHVATCAATRTLFAGVGPDALHLSPDTACWSDEGFGADPFRYTWRRSVPSLVRFDLDADTSTLDGRALPSRTLTGFGSVTHGRARERLQFRRRPDGGLDVQAADGFAPLEAPGSIVLRDATGAWFVGAGGTTLRAVTEAEGRRAWDRLVVDASTGDPRAARDDDGWGWRHEPMADDLPPPAGLALGVQARLPASVPPGAYLARTTRAPGFDDLGLAVRWLRAHHVVFGVLAAEDLDG